MTRVVHIMREKYDVYIGRPTKWGNPYTYKDGTRAQVKVASREEALEKFEKYACGNKEIMDSLDELKDKTLGCWCAGKEALTAEDPIICHGQILIRLLEERYNVS